MTIQQLRFFIAVDKYKKFTTAANELYISQSSLSKQIMALEKELGVTLFIRSTRQVNLTDVGRELLELAKRIVAEYEKMDLCVSRYKRNNANTISLGGVPVLNRYGITKAVLQFEKAYAKCRVKITETVSSDVFKMLRLCKLDLGIVRLKLPLDHSYDDYNIIPFIDDEQVLVVGCNHPFAPRTDIDLKEAADEQFIQLNTDPFCTVYHTSLIKQAGIFPPTHLTTMRMDSIKSYIIQKGYVSLMMKRVAKALPESEVSIVPLSSHPTLNLSIITRKNDISSLCNEFINYLLNTFQRKKIIL